MSKPRSEKQTILRQEGSGDVWIRGLFPVAVTRMQDQLRPFFQTGDAFEPIGKRSPKASSVPQQVLRLSILADPTWRASDGPARTVPVFLLSILAACS